MPRRGGAFFRSDALLLVSFSTTLLPPALALRLRVLREELAARVGEVKACGRCVQPRSVSWPGGHCCSGRTRNLFTDHELLALRLSGTKSAHLKPPRSEHAGCAFRGPHGCSLDTAHRPSLCVRYMCRELQSEIEQRSDAPAIAHLQEKLRVGVERFEGLVKERTLARDDELCRRTMLHLRRNR